MQTQRLTAHPAHPPAQVSAIEARIGGPQDGWLRLRWRVEGAGALTLPRFAGSRRMDGLWRTTCFELFVREKGSPSYREFNFAPSEAWAAYSFAGYREDMREAEIPRAPVITPRRGRDLLIMDVALRMEGLCDEPFEYGLCAVLEEEGGILSYWALAHPPAKPDFHDPACFAATLAPAQQA